MVALGGTVERQLAIISGFEASVPATGSTSCAPPPASWRSIENASVTLTSTEVDDQAGLNGSMQRVTHEMTGASAMWDAGYTGAGVDVALIDSGVVPVDGLRTAGKVVNGPDLSFEAVLHADGCTPSPLATLDTYGHGTHLAGIIAGRDDAAPAPSTAPRRATSSAWRRTPGSSASRSLTPRGVPTSRRRSPPSTG